jgi:hypothetical protein
MRKPEIIEKLK